MSNTRQAESVDKFSNSKGIKMESDKKLLVSKRDMIFWISIFTAFGFCLGLMVSVYFDIQRISAETENTNARIKHYDSLIKKLDEVNLQH